MKSITVIELDQWLKTGVLFQLIDVRERHEHEAFNLGGKLLPLSEIVYRVDELEKEVPVVIYCRVGMRSQIAIQRLLDKYPFTNLVNLVGGTEAWQRHLP